jgi:hypothetical protein
MSRKGPINEEDFTYSQLDPVDMLERLDFNMALDERTSSIRRKLCPPLLLSKIQRQALGAEHKPACLRGLQVGLEPRERERRVPSRGKSESRITWRAFELERL